MGKRTMALVEPKRHVSQICADLRELQRQRVCNLKSRIMIANRLTATVATSHGYHAGMEEGERTKRFAEAAKVIARIKAGDTPCENEAALSGLVSAASMGIDGFDAMVRGYEKEMVRLAKQLPVASWVQQPEQRGFGLLSLAIVVGEAGNLSDYANPAKLWKRMGCAPYESGGVMQMPATWKSKGGLSAEEWTELGYSPRRRSIAYLIGEGLVKQNGGVAGCEAERSIAANGNGGAGDCNLDTEGRRAGPYRTRYDQTKAKLQADHPDYPKLRCHRHGMLLATKLLLKNLWIKWTGGEPSCETETMTAGVHLPERRGRLTTTGFQQTGSVS